MVKLSPEVREAELAALIRSQREDRRTRHVRRQAVGVQTATDLQIDFDRLPGRPGALVLIEGRPQHYDLRHVGHVCPRCGDRAGSNVCLVCNGGGEGRTLRGKETPCPGGPTSYAGNARGLRGGKGR